MTNAYARHVVDGAYCNWCGASLPAGSMNACCSAPCYQQRRRQLRHLGDEIRDTPHAPTFSAPNAHACASAE
jgi:hypothetical protein